MTLRLCRWVRRALVLLLPVQLCLGFEVTGATGGIDPTTGALPSRYEISSFSQSGPPFHLFILALFEIQRVSQSDPMSYFQIAGIHGYPMAPYDGVQGTGTYPGWCIHAAVLFPTWHRPYVALYEQAIWHRAQDLAAQYPSEIRAQYQAAAASLRVPYWDWASYAFLPAVVNTPSISIVTPTGNMSIPNPLYSYKFQSDAEGNGFPASHPLAGLPETVRHYNTTTQKSNESAADASLSANAPTIASLVYQLFANVKDYSTFSCSAPGGHANVANNIETIHNSIHNSVGGWGHMQFPEVAAFDPIFFLHHANVDRLLALWQALNPDQWILPSVNTYGSFFEVPGTIDNSDSSLAPFHSDNGTSMFSSDEVRSSSTFRYTYPEMSDHSMNASTLMTHVRQQVNRLYNPFMPVNRVNRKRMIARPLRRAANFATAFSRITLDDAKRFEVNNANRQWFAKVIIDRFAWRTSFALYFFMGEPPKSPTSWPTATNLIGTQGQSINADVVAMHPEGTPNGTIEGEVTLTHTLVGGMKRGFLADLSPDSVLPVLKQALHWRASAADGCEIDCSQLSGLVISVGSRTTEPAKDENCFPTYGTVEWHGDVTQGKPGGARQYYWLAYD